MPSFPAATIVPIYQYHRVLPSGKDTLYFFSTEGDLGEWWILDKIVWYGSSTPFPGMSAVYQFSQPLPDGNGAQAYFSLDPTPQSGWESVQIAWYSIDLNEFSAPYQVYQYEKPLENSDLNQYLYTTNSKFGGGWKMVGPIFAGTTLTLYAQNGTVTDAPTSNCWEFTPSNNPTVYIRQPVTDINISPGDSVAVICVTAKQRDCPGPGFNLLSIVKLL